MYETLKQEVLAANKALPTHGLVVLTWGNVSAIDRTQGHIVIKPSGVAYDALKSDMLVVVDMDGNTIEGTLRPSSDTPTHLELYRQFPDIGSIIHTHSEWATSWAQTGMDILVYGTTHGDYFYGDIPCTRDLDPEEVEQTYELNTGRLIVETFKKRNIDPSAIPGVLVKNHGPFVWGKTATEAVEHAIVLEEIAKMAFRTQVLLSTTTSAPGYFGAYRAQARRQLLRSMPQYLLDKHFLRKHGKNAYYGQKPPQD